MIPEAFTYERAGSIAEALEHMGRGAQPLAGGHSLVPALKLRLSAPEALVDIGAHPRAHGHPRRRRHARDRRVHAPPRRRRERRGRGQRRRARGGRGAASATSRCATAARSAARWRRPTRTATCRRSLLALGAEIVVQSASGTRTIAADDFFVDYYTTALEDGELITEIRIPGGQSQGAYAKFSRRAQDWAIIGAAVSKGAGGWRVGLCGAGADGACAQAASRRRSPPARRRRTPPRTRARASSPEAGLDGSTEYKRHLATVMVRRALEAAGA